MNRMHSPRTVTRLMFLGLLATVIADAGAADAPAMEQVATAYTSAARPLLARYCLECHSTELMEGDLDLERFASLSDVRNSTRVWLKVAEMLDSGEMPPKDARRMPARDRQTLRDWLTQYLRAESVASAGDTLAAEHVRDQ